MQHDTGPRRHSHKKNLYPLAVWHVSLCTVATCTRSCTQGRAVKTHRRVRAVIYTNQRPLFLPWRKQLNVNRLHLMVVEVTLHFPKWRIKLCRGNNSLLTPKAQLPDWTNYSMGPFLKRAAAGQRASVKASEPVRRPHTAIHLKQTKRSHMWCE